MKKISRALIAFVMLAAGCAALGQTSPIVTGNYPYGTYQNHGFDTINVGNLNLQFSIPILHKSGRGLPFYYDLTYDSSIWHAVTVSGSLVWTPAPAFGWQGNTDSELETGYVSYQRFTQTRILPGPGGLLVACTTHSCPN